MKVKAFTIAFTFLLLLLIPAIPAKDDGITNKSVSGCSCHNAGEGLADVSIDLPEGYIGGQSYSLQINVSLQGSTNGGGFNLATSLGTLSTNDPNAKIVGNEAVHSNPQSNTWVVDWFAPPSGSGIVTFNLAGLASDGNGQKSGDGWSTIAIDVPESNSPPSITNFQLLPLNATSSQSLEISYDYSDNENDPDTSTIVWLKNGVVDSQGIVSNNPNLLQIDFSKTTRDDLWVVQLTPSDGENIGTTITSETTIINSKPIISNLTINPSGPSQNDDLTANWDEYDEDGDVLSRLIKWFKDGSHQSELDGLSTISNSLTEENEEWYFSITLNDTFEDNIANSSSVVLNMINDVPTLENLEIENDDSWNDEPTTTSNLIAEWDFLDGDGDDLANYEIRWYSNNLVQLELEDLVVVDSNFTSKNESWYFEVRASDGVEFSEWYQSDSVLINNSKPELFADIIPLNPTNSSDLELDLYSFDPDGDDLVIEVEWIRNNTFFGKYIYSEDSSYGPISNDTVVGQTWYANISITDGESRIIITTETVTIFPDILSNDSVILENFATETYFQSVTYGVVTMVTFMLVQFLLSVKATKERK